MVFIPLSSQGNKLVTEIERTIGNSGDFELIDERIEKRFALRIQEVTRVVGLVRHDGGAHGAWLFEHNLNEDSIPSPKLTDEIFGPASIIFRYSKLTQVLEVLQMIGGQLAVALYATESDGSVVPELACRLLRFAGRIVWCGVPTGVAVVDAMHHGGPWPASNSVIGSVGPEAILRFRRPVTWQGFPTFAMPLHLRPGHQEKDSFKVFTRSSDLA
jgi:NADP-dependent aldehyde dehydrogenase